ncbi:MAG: hypothetical protein DCC75_11315, partial [Proteobacteria bacterium]
HHLHNSLIQLKKSQKIVFPIHISTLAPSPLDAPQLTAAVAKLTRIMLEHEAMKVERIAAAEGVVADSHRDQSKSRERGPRHGRSRDSGRPRGDSRGRSGSTRRSRPSGRATRPQSDRGRF